MIGLALLTIHLLYKDAADISAAWCAAGALIAYGAHLAYAAMAEELSEKNMGHAAHQRHRTLEYGHRKLFGGTIFAWYCFALFAGGALMMGGGFALETWITVLLLAIMIHALNLLSILLMVTAQEVPARTKLYNHGGALFLTFFVAMPYLQFVLLSHTSIFNFASDAMWWGLPLQSIHVALLAVFTVWAIIGAWRMMQQALAVSSTPWLWVVFLVWVGFFAAGLDESGTFRFTYAFIAMLPFVYAIALYDARSIVAWRRWLMAFYKKDWLGLWQRTPAWVSGLVLCALCALPAMGEQIVVQGKALSAVSLLLFAMRDIALMHLVSFQKPGRNRNAVVLVYLFMLYSVAPALTNVLGLHVLTAAFLPMPSFGNQPHSAVIHVVANTTAYSLVMAQIALFAFLALRKAQLAQKKLPELASAPAQ